MDGASRFLAGLGAGYLHLLAGATVQIALIPFLIDRAGAHEAGTYLLLMTVSQFAAVGVGWLAAAGVRLIGGMQAQDPKNFRVIHQAVFAGFLAYGLLFFMVCLIAAALIGPVWMDDIDGTSQQQLRNAVVLLGAYVAVNYAHQADLAGFVGLLEQGRANLYRLAAICIFAAGAVPLMIIAPRIDFLMLMQALSAALCFITARCELTRRGFVGRRWWQLPRMEVTRSLFLQVGAAYLLFGVAQLILQLGDVLLVGALLGPAEVAAYAILVKVPELLALVFSRVSDTLTPYFVRLDARMRQRDRLTALFVSTSFIQHALALCAAAFYVLAGPWILELWVGEANRPANLLPYTLAAAFIFFQVVNQHDIVLHFACARVVDLLPVRFFEVVAKIGLTFLLFDEVGFIAPLMSYFIVQVLGVTWWYRILGIRLAGATRRDWFKGVLRPMALAAVVALLLPLMGVLTSQSAFVQLALAGMVVISAFLNTRRAVRRVRALLNGA